MAGELSRRPTEEPLIIRTSGYSGRRVEYGHGNSSRPCCGWRARRSPSVDARQRGFPGLRAGPGGPHAGNVGPQCTASSTWAAERRSRGSFSPADLRGRRVQPAIAGSDSREYRTAARRPKFFRALQRQVGALGSSRCPRCGSSPRTTSRAAGDRGLDRIPPKDGDSLSDESPQVDTREHENPYRGLQPAFAKVRSHTPVHKGGLKPAIHIQAAPRRHPRA